MDERAKSYKQLPLPPNPLPELTSIFFRAGPVTVCHEGDRPLWAQDLQAWAAGCKVKLTGPEFELILRMSHEYWEQKLRSQSPSCPAPWTEKPKTLAKAAEISKRIKSVLRS